MDAWDSCFFLLFSLDIFDHTFQRKGNSTVKGVVEVFDAMLCFDAWLKQDTFWNNANCVQAMKSAHASIEALLRLCSKSIPAMKDNCWKFPKFHELLHIVDDIERFGAPRNFNAERPEALSINAAKRPGRRAQKRHEGALYELQSAQRVAESIIIDMVHTRIWGSTTAPDDSADEVSDVDSEILQSAGQATLATVTCSTSTTLLSLRKYKIMWHTRTNITMMKLPMPLLHFLMDQFGSPVNLATEYVRDVYTFRCHHAYQSGCAINDWMNVKFDNGCICPCRLAAVVVLDNNPNNPERFRLVVQAAIKRSHEDSVLFTEWSWLPLYQSTSPNTIHAPCFVISIKDDGSKILVTRPYDEWPAQFTHLH